jgi:cyclic lactone autoinducer peptide
MKNTNEKSKLKAILSKKVLSSSLASLKNDADECILILYEPKQPENLKEVDLEQLRKNLG